MTPTAGYAAFSSTLPLTGFDNLRRSEIYRYDADGDEIECASCPPTNGGPDHRHDDGPDGLSLTDDGRVFFTSPSRSSSATSTATATPTSGTKARSS